MMRFGFALLLTILLAGISLAGERKAPPWEKPLEEGRDLYRENCVVCHEINKPEAGKKPGPSLFRFFQNDKTPLTNVPPSVRFITLKIKFGGNIMPAFGNYLDDREIALILDYIRSKH